MHFSLNTGKNPTNMCVCTNVHLNREGKLPMATNN